jgi:hypothetical protein
VKNVQSNIAFLTPAALDLLSSIFRSPEVDVDCFSKRNAESVRGGREEEEEEGERTAERTLDHSLNEAKAPVV